MRRSSPGIIYVILVAVVLIGAGGSALFHFETAGAL